MANRSNIPIENPDLTTILNLVKREIKAEMNCVSIGKIQAFDATNMTATITINYQKVLKNGTTNSKGDVRDVIIEYPVLVRVPVVILNGGGGYLTFPITAGDQCILMFCDRDIDNWMKTESASQPPNSMRLHDLTDAIALVGIKSFQSPISNYSTTNVEMKHLTGDISLYDQHEERLVPPGTGPIPTLLSTAPSGWVFMYGQTMGKSSGTESGTKFKFLFDILKDVYPNSGSEDFDSGDTIIIPDMRGRIPLGKDDMGGSSAGVVAQFPEADVLGGIEGEETHLLTGRESGIQQHSHPFPLNTSNDGGTSGRAVNSNGAGTNTNGVTSTTGHTNAIDEHNNVQPFLTTNYMIKY